METHAAFSIFGIIALLAQGSLSVLIKQGNEISNFTACSGDTDDVFVDLLCISQLSTISTATYVSIQWTDITDPSNEIRVVTIDNSSNLVPGNDYRNVSITRLNTGRLDGSIRLQLEGKAGVRLIVFNCEVTVFDDEPGVYKRPVTALNSGCETTPVTCPVYDCPVTNQSCVTVVVDTVGPGLSIALSIAGILMFCYNVIMLLVVKDGPLSKLLPTTVSRLIVWVLGAVGVLVCVAAVAMSAVFISQPPACSLSYKDLEVAAAVCSPIGVFLILPGFIYIWKLPGNGTDSQRNGQTLEMGNGKPPLASPKTPKSGLSRTDVKVDMKGSTGRPVASPRKNSVEPMEKKADPKIQMARKLPPLPSVDVDSNVRRLKKKPKKKKNLTENLD